MRAPSCRAVLTALGVASLGLAGAWADSSTPVNLSNSPTAEGHPDWR
jgi:hypothetical protein